MNLKKFTILLGCTFGIFVSDSFAMKHHQPSYPICGIEALFLNNNNHTFDNSKAVNIEEANNVVMNDNSAMESNSPCNTRGTHSKTNCPCHCIASPFVLSDNRRVVVKNENVDIKESNEVAINNIPVIRQNVVANPKWEITIDLMMIVGKYFESNNDFINVIKLNKKYKELVKMYKMNPISDVSLFKKIQTQHFFIK